MYYFLGFKEQQRIKLKKENCIISSSVSILLRREIVICMVQYIRVRSMLNKHKKRDDWFLDDYTINPYQGCEFNCVYCYIHGSKYGERIGTRFAVKENALTVLSRQLKNRARRGEYGIIAISSSTEPYMPVEKELKLTRGILKTVLRYRFPVEIITKSSLVLRDLDVLEEIDKVAILPEDLQGKLRHGAIISFSLSTLDEEIARIFEPGAPSPVERLRVMKKCKDNNFFVGLNFIPVLPFLSDEREQLEEMIKTAKDVGADYVFVGVLTLFGTGKELYYKVLEKHFPELVPKYKKLFRAFSYPPREYQAKLEATIKEICKKYGMKIGIV